MYIADMKTLFNKIEEQNKTIDKIRDALGTGEIDEALIEVARNAHKAEMELAALQRKYDELNEAYGQEMVLSANLKAELNSVGSK